MSSLIIYQYQILDFVGLIIKSNSRFIYDVISSNSIWKKKKESYGCLLLSNKVTMWNGWNLTSIHQLHFKKHLLNQNFILLDLNASNGSNKSRRHYQSQMINVINSSSVCINFQNAVSPSKNQNTIFIPFD